MEHHPDVESSTLLDNDGPIDSNSSFSKYTNIFNTLDGKSLIGMSSIFFMYFSFLSGSFFNPFEWVALIGVITGSYFLFLQKKPIVKSLSLRSLLDEVEEIQQAEKNARREELKALVRNIRVTLISGSGLAIKDKFKRCRYFIKCSYH